MKSVMLKNLSLQIQKFLDFIDGLLDPITSYRLVLYFLYCLAGWAILVAAISSKSVPFGWYKIALSTVFLMAICRTVNHLLSRTLNIPRNNDSDLITALILALIMSPASSFSNFLILGLAGAFAMASKYILVISRRHIFNPAALGAYLTGIIFHQYASWWVGTAILTPLVLLGGLLIIRKMKRYIMVTTFISIYLIILALNVASKQSTSLIWHNIWVVLTASPLLFFASIMLIEPLTSPNKIAQYIPYSTVVAALYGITKLRISPEEALLVGNTLSYGLAPYKRYKLSFLKKQREAEGIYSFSFASKDKPAFEAGQYMEWTIPSSQSDNRGNRRYLTLSSSPTEKELAFTIKVPTPTSSFKLHLNKFKEGDALLITHLAGSFVLPKDQNQKLAFVAGGVGITPFRSIAKYLLDTDQWRDIRLVYSANNDSEFAFKGLFSQAEKIGLRTSYSTTKFDSELIEQVLPDFRERLFYVSGPYGFIKVILQVLMELGLPRKKIITDYFPGYG